jgi:hypothetical protein
LLEYWRRDIYTCDLGTALQPFDAEAAQAVLARVAWWMHQELDRTAAPLDELAAEAEIGLAEVSASSRLGRDGRAFLERMRDEAGILAMSGDGTWHCGFLHLSFQEYLAAEHAAQKFGDPPVDCGAIRTVGRKLFDQPAVSGSEVGGHRVFAAVSKAYDGDLQMIDSSSIRVHQHAANVKKGARKPPLGTSLEPDAWGARGAD